MVAKNCEKLLSKFECILCQYNTSRKSSYDKHLFTARHINRTKLNNAEKPNVNTEKLMCKNCNKVYKVRNSLWYHEQKCKKIENVLLNQINQNSSIHDASNNVILLLINENKELINDNKDFKNIIMELVKNNNDLQKQIVDVCQKIQPGTINNTNSNNINTTHNKTFNLQFFLNEECKDAMNMSEFINSIELKLSDIENIGKVGYVEGMSNIIIKKLNNTDMYKRPVHCSDAKRETLYVKEENKWEKEGPENSKMLKAVYGMNKKNYVMLNVWKEAHPTCLDGQTKQCDQYMQIMCKVMDGNKENINKVIKRLTKEVVINK